MNQNVLKELPRQATKPLRSVILTATGHHRKKCLIISRYIFKVGKPRLVPKAFWTVTVNKVEKINMAI